MTKRTTTKPTESPKRPNGAGSIYPVGTGFRTAIPYRDPVTGKSRKRYLSAKTRVEADRLLAANLTAREAGEDLYGHFLKDFRPSPW